MAPSQEWTDTYVVKTLGALAILAVLLPASAYAQDQRGWIDVNIGIAVPAVATSNAWIERTISQETARFEADYSWSRGADFDFGGGVMLSRIVGIGVSVSGTAHVNPATVSARIPHPARFNLFGSDSMETDEGLTKAEGAIHVQAMVNAVDTARTRVRVFGGPSYFRVTQDTFDDIRYLQSWSLAGINNVEITSAPFSEAEATAWGFHVGGDVAVFFNRVVGIGGFARFSQASIELVDLGGAILDTKAGGFQTGGGLRLRF